MVAQPVSSTPAPSPPQLRPYQAQLIKDLYEKLAAGHRRVAIIAGTGAGKTVISGQICAHAESRGCRLLFLVHLDVLVGQTFDKMKSFGLHCGFIKAGWPEDPTAPIQIASIQTMAKRDWWRNWSAHMVFYDEAHTTVFSQIGQEVLYTTHPKAVHLAMTATPYRLGNDQLGDHMDTLVHSPVPSELQKMGFLAKMKYFGMPKGTQVNLEGVRTVAGDFDERDLKNACDRPELVQRIVDEWQRLTPHKRTIAFCVDLDHARHVAEAFQAAGVSAAVVEGGTPIKERQQLYAALKAGTLLVLTSCNVISIGFDEPSVEVGLLLRPTQSKALHQQQIGRVMRISPGTGKHHGIILDQAGNLQRLGFPEDIQSYRLPTTKESTGPAAIPAKQCPACSRLVWSFLLECPDCGHEWPQETTVLTEDLVELLSDEQLRQLREQRMKRFLKQRRKADFRNHQSPNWTRHAFFEKFGCHPKDEWFRGCLFGDTPSDGDRLHYKQYLVAIAREQKKPLTWVIDEFQLEFGADDWKAHFPELFR
jgi:superfamily II DNA or RNA helicase